MQYDIIKGSYFDVGRTLTNDEWEELKVWRAENKTLKFKFGDPHPSMDGKFFRAYHKARKNGEEWCSAERIDAIIAAVYAWNENNPGRRKEIANKSSAKQRVENSDRINNRQKEYKEKRTPEQLDRVRAYRRNYEKERRENDPLYKLTQDLRSRNNLIFRSIGIQKDITTKEILGIDYEGFLSYIESKFEPWMNWGNKGGGAGVHPPNTFWDIDHIVPLSTAKTKEDIVRLNHYSNMRPMCSYENRYVKKDRLDWNG